MKLQGKWLWRGALTLLALALAWLWLRPTPVTTLTLAAQPVQRSVVATGRVEAIRESVLGSTVTARVVATPVKQGAHVAAGATLLTEETLGDGSVLVMLRDPWGVALQICQRAKPFPGF